MGGACAQANIIDELYYEIINGKYIETSGMSHEIKTKLQITLQEQFLQWEYLDSESRFDLLKKSNLTHYSEDLLTLQYKNYLIENPGIRRIIQDSRTIRITFPKQIQKVAKQCLMIDFGTVFEGTATPFPVSESDLKLYEICDGMTQILSNGVNIFKTLTTLTKDFNVQIIMHSKCKEQEQIQYMNILLNACSTRGIPFPQISGMAVRDSSQYQGVLSSEPVIVATRFHGIRIAGYDIEQSGRSCLRQAISVLMDIDADERKNHILIDRDAASLEKARMEGWQTYEVSEFANASNVITQIYLRAEFQIQSNQRAVKLLSPQSDKNQTIELFDSKQGSNSDLSPSEYAVSPGPGSVLNYQTPINNGIFVGRKKQLIEVRNCLSQYRIACVCGMSGFGKTELALEISQEYDSIVWLNAEFDNLTSEIRNFMENEHTESIPIGITDEKLLTEQFFASFTEKSLIVFENAPDETSVRKLLIPGNQPQKDSNYAALSSSESVKAMIEKLVFISNQCVRVLITSQSLRWTFPSVQLSPFLLEEFQDLVQNVGPIAQSQQQDDITALFQVLEGNPVGSFQALKYINLTSVPVSQYIEQFTQLQNNLHGLKDIESRVPATTFIISFSLLVENQPLNKQVMSICAYLSRFHLSINMLNGFLFGNVQQCLLNLVDYGLLRFSTSQTSRGVRINGVIQNILKQLHQKDGMLERWCSKVYDYTQPLLSFDASDVYDVRRASLLIPHAQAFILSQNNLGMTQEKEILDLIAMHQLYGVGNFEGAKLFFLQKLELVEKFLGSEHLEVGTTLANLGNAYGGLGMNVQKLECLAKGLKICQMYLSSDHASVLEILVNMSRAMHHLKQYDEQIETLNRILDIQEAKFGKLSPETAETLTNMGIAWGNKGDFNKKIKLLVKAYEINSQKMGQDHITTTQTLTNLATAYGEIFEYDQQQELLDKAVKNTEQHYGPDHPQTAVVLSLIGSCLKNKGNTVLAFKNQMKAYKIFTSYYGAAHSFTLFCKAQLDLIKLNQVQKKSESEKEKVY